jgi:hypothetical protein
VKKQKKKRETFISPSLPTANLLIKETRPAWTVNNGKTSEKTKRKWFLFFADKIRY